MEMQDDVLIEFDKPKSKIKETIKFQYNCSICNKIFQTETKDDMNNRLRLHFTSAEHKTQDNNKITDKK